MNRFVIACAGVLLATALFAEPTTEEMRKRPITVGQGALANLLHQWWKNGTAAGNSEDWYDNRDREHSELNRTAYPQLRKVAYSEADRAARRDWGLQPRVLPHIVFGNSSTSAPPQLTGSNPRTMYCARDGLRLLDRQYRGNNLYIYPEHRDHDPGHNGIGDGYGDLFPTNTPYLIISQGSSGTDQPFMRAVPFTLAAFRPEVKQKLAEAGLLMPTVQMILRRCNKHLTGADDYFTGKAHPTVFEGNAVDPLGMARMAHAIRADATPPLVQLTVVEEEAPVAVRDYFEPPWLSEQKGDAPAVIARIWRGQQQRRRLVVSAEKSIDLNKRPLSFRWVLLRGDPKRVTIQPRGTGGSSAEITVAYHERRPIAPGSPLASNRVDIGVFADNGVQPSPPAFITFYSLDSEARSYDQQKRIVEIGHGMGFSEPRLTDLAAGFAALGRDDLPARLLQLTVSQRDTLAGVARRLAPLAERRALARQQHDAAAKERNRVQALIRDREQALAKLRADKKPADEVAAAERAVAGARDDHAAATKVLTEAGKRLTGCEEEMTKASDERLEALAAAPRAFVLAALRQALATPTLWNDHRPALAERAGDQARQAEARRVLAAIRKLVQLGIIEDKKDREIVFLPVLPGDGAAVQRLSAYQKAMIEEFNGVVLSELVLPGAVTIPFQAHFVDARLTTPKRWRDVYRHDGDTLVGWTRYSPGDKSPVEFTAEGWRVIAKDEQGRPVKARTVVYRQTYGTPGQRQPPLEMHDGPEVVTLRYDGGKRTIAGRETVPE